MPATTLLANTLHRQPAVQAAAYDLRVTRNARGRLTSYVAVASTLGLANANAAMYACQQEALRRDGNYDAILTSDRGGAWRGGPGAGIVGTRSIVAGATWLPNSAPLTDDVTFAVEIEVAGGLGSDPVGSANRLLRTTIDTVSGETFATLGWVAVYDGSVSAGCEVKPGILRGEAGLAQAVAVCALLKGAGARVSSSCGLHVHVGTDGMTAAQIERVIDWSVAAQPMVSWLHPADRRNNMYAQPMNASRARVAKDLLHRRTLVQGHYDQRRYVALNLCAFQFHGTLEFRQAAGTLAGNVLSAWVRLVVAVMQAARTNTLVVPTAPFRTVEAMLAGLPLRQATAEAFLARARRHGAPAAALATQAA